jgi:3-methyl-2-oxobutanoate hydroxymethyltransferase
VSAQPEQVKKLLIADLWKMKAEGRKITMITAYSYPQGLIVDEAGIDIILVGDSLGMVELGYRDTIPVTMEEMLAHTKPVVRAAKRAHVVGDLPFMSYNISLEQAVANAGVLYKDGGADSVKLEGGQEMARVVETVVKAGIPVFGHIGLTPQTAALMGGFKVQGKSLEQAHKVFDDALALEAAGAFALILEAIPKELAALITQAVKVPTVGIGAGVGCDGQVLVLHDMLGVYPRPSPKFSRNFMPGAASIEEAVKAYIAAVRTGAFPGPEHSFHSP